MQIKILAYIIYPTYCAPFDIIHDHKAMSINAKICIYAKKKLIWIKIDNTLYPSEKIRTQSCWSWPDYLTFDGFLLMR